jgi:cobalamin biosynthesis protein CobT
VNSAQAFIKSLPITASALAKRFGITVTFKGDTASTDGKKINLPAAVLVAAEELSEDQMLLIRGYLDHESSHLACNPADMLQNLHGLSGVQRYFWNILQDGRDERIFSHMFPGAKTNLVNLALETHKENAEKMSEATAAVTVWLLKFVRYASFGMFHKEVSEDARAVDRLIGRSLRKAIEKEAKEGVFAESYQDVADHAQKIVSLLKDAADETPPSDYSSSASSQREDEDEAGADSSGGKDEDDASGSPSETDDGDNEADSGSSSSGDSGDSGDDSGAGGSGDEGHDDASGSPSETDEGDNGADSGSSSAGDSGDDYGDGSCTSSAAGDEGTPSSDAESDVDTKAPGLNGNGSGDSDSEDKSSDEKAGRAQAARRILNEDFDEIDGPHQTAFKSIPKKYLPGAASPQRLSSLGNVHCVTALDDSLVYNATVTLRTRLAGLLQSQERARTLIGTRGKLVGRKLYKLATNDPRMFAKTQQVEGKRIAVHLLVDLSASMMTRTEKARDGAAFPAVLNGDSFMESPGWEPCGFTLSETALAAAQSFAVAVRQIPQVNLGVTAFPGNAEDKVVTLLEHGSQIDRAPRWNFVVSGGTPLAQAVWYAYMRMQPLPEPRRVLVILTDGRPDSSEDARIAVSAASRAGIEVIGLSIYGDHLRCVMPSEQFSVIRKPEDIAPAYFSLLERLLLTGGKTR